MLYNNFGTIPVSVSRLGFGGAAVSGEGGGYGFGDISEADSISLLHEAYDAGINLFDTAPVYGYGLSEERIGKAFPSNGGSGDYAREKIFIVSKCGITWRDNKRIYRDNSPAVVEQMLETSLRTIGTDYLDLYLVHFPDMNVDIRATLEPLIKAKEEGRVRYLGLSNFSHAEISAAQEVARIDVLQSEFNAFHRTPAQELFPLLDRLGMGFMSYGTLDKGILTGRVTKAREARRAYDASDLRSWAPWWRKDDLAGKCDAVARLKMLLEKEGYNLLDFAVHWVLSHATVSTALCGIRNIGQLREMAAALEKPLPPELLKDGLGLLV